MITDERWNEPDDGSSVLKFCVLNGGFCCRSLSGKATLIPVRLEERSILFNGGLTEARTAPQKVLTAVQFVFLFYTPKPQAGAGKQVRL